MKRKVKLAYFIAGLCLCVGVLTWQMKKSRIKGVTVIEIGGKEFIGELVD